MKKSILAILCALILTGCGTGGGTTPTETNTDGKTNYPEEAISTTDVSSTETEAETEIYNGLVAHDFGGDTFTIANYPLVYQGHSNPEIDAPEMNGEVLNDAIYNRNSVLEEKYNIYLSSAPFSSHAEIATEIEKAVIAGDETYDAAFPGLSMAFQLAVKGYLYDLSKIPFLKTDSAWWMTDVLTSTSISGKNYFVPGDMHIGAMNAAGIIYFNKKVVTNYGLESPYSVVNEGKWTLDEMKNYCKIVTHDADGNGIMDQNDAYGFDCSSFAWQPLFYGSGNLLISKDENDIPFLNAESEQNYDYVTTIVKLLNDSSATYNIHHAVGVSDLAGFGINRFMSDQTLFFIELMYGVPEFREMEGDFGLLPLPKATETQEYYSTYLHPHNASSVVVPIINAKLDETGMILEDMAFYSSQYIRPAFYEVMLKTKYARDNESSQMLDIILSKFTIDLALVMKDSGIDIDTIMRSAVVEGNTDIFSSIVAKKQVYTSILDSATEALK